MSNDNLILNHAQFFNLNDNAVKQRIGTWAEMAPLLTTHVLATDQKAFLPCFNGWHYKDISDPTADKGFHSDGKAVKNFSPMGVRRIQENLISLSMLICDFDGAMLLSEVQTVFGEYEYVCYTSLNHQVEIVEEKKPAVDRFRVVLPFASPMPVDKFRELVPAMSYWIDGDGHEIADPVTFRINQIFLLPAVREEHQSMTKAWRNKGKLLDWKMFESMPKVNSAKPANRIGVSSNAPTNFKLKPDDMLQTATGFVIVGQIDRKISKVLCPFHGDVKPGEFAGITTNGTPFLQCKKCGRIYMDRTSLDPIVAGIAKLKKKNRRRSSEGEK